MRAAGWMGRAAAAALGVALAGQAGGAGAAAPSAGAVGATAQAAPAVETPLVHSLPRADPPDTLPASAPVEAGTGIAYGGTPVDALTYHYDHWRTGWNARETDLTPAAVASGRFGLIKTLKVDGVVLAQPLVVSGFTMADGARHEVLLVATEHDGVYAFDARDFSLLWRKDFGPSQSSADLGCEDIAPEYGITSTPVIVRSGDAATVYVVTADEPSTGVFETWLRALDLRTGKEAFPAVRIDPFKPLSNGREKVFDPKHQYARTALAAAGRDIYVGIGSHCDLKPTKISGWMLSFDSRLRPLAKFNTIDDPVNYELASIWMTGFAPAIDQHGEVYAVTGNGSNNLANHGHNAGEAVIHLSPDLLVMRDNFTPNAEETLNQYDEDQGSGGVMLIPPGKASGPTALAVQAGKSGILYLLDAGDLGGQSSNDAGALQSQTIGDGGGLWGGPAFYTSRDGGSVFVQVDGDVLRGYRLRSGDHPRLDLAMQGTSVAGYGGSLPIVSSNGQQRGSGVVWLVRRTHHPELQAYDASSLGAPIFAAQAGSWRNPENNAFVTPQEANGRVYVGTQDTVTVWGLTR